MDYIKAMILEGAESHILHVCGGGVGGVAEVTNATDLWMMVILK